MGMTVFICIIVFIIIWPVGMIVLKACSRDVRVAGGIIEQERSECLNITSGKIQPEFRIPSSELRTFPLSQAVKTRATLYTSGSDMISFRDTFDSCGLIMAPLKHQ
jgi:hypothetical protein